MEQAPLSAATRTVIGACPLDCPDGCSWVVTVEQGPEGELATKLRGNGDHPFTQGQLCKKVNPWLRIASEPGRLLQPLRRVAPKGPGRQPEEAFVPISWDEAIAEIADRFTKIIETTGPQAIWPFVGTGNVGNIQGSNLGARTRLWNALGVSDHQVTICSVSGHVGLGYTMGMGTSLNPEEVVGAKTVIVWGANPVVTGHHWWPFVEKARANGAHIVVIDPVLSRTASRADEHLAPRVGTDGALALGLCRAIIEAGGVDETFVSERTDGFDAFAAEVAPWTPQRVAEVCDITPEQLNGLACRLVDDPKVVIKLGQGMQRHAAGGQASRTVSCIAALIGAFDHRGMGVFYSTDPVYRFNKFGTGGGGLARGPRRRLAMTNLSSNLAGAPGSDAAGDGVEALFVYGANPVVSNPDLNGVRAGLGRDDLFTVVVDLFHTETTDYADIVLPSTMQHEQWEVNHSFAHVYVNLNQPAVDPPGECKPHTEIFRLLGRAMGVEAPAVYASDEELIETLLDTPDLRAAGITFESLKQTGWAAMPNTEEFHPFAERFATASGRFEFASERAANDGYGAVASYHPPLEAGRSDRGDGYFYDLVAAGSEWFVNSVFAGTEVTMARTSAPEVRVGQADAKRDGLVDGEPVVISNDRGSFTATVRIDPALRSGIAATDKGWWRMGLNATVADRDSDMGRGAIFHDNRVAIRPEVSPG